MIRSPLIARIKRTSVLVSTEKRLAEDLETMKRMVHMLEKETDMLENYRPLAERTAHDMEGDVKMASPVKENGSNDESHVHRGSAALRARLEKLLPITNEEETDEARIHRVCKPRPNGRTMHLPFCVMHVCPAAHNLRGSVLDLSPFRLLLLLLLCRHCRPSRRTTEKMRQACQNAIQ